MTIVNIGRVDKAFLGQPVETMDEAMQNMFVEKVKVLLGEEVDRSSSWEYLNPSRPIRRGESTTISGTKFLENVEWITMEEFMLGQYAEQAHDILGVKTWNAWKGPRVKWLINKMKGKMEDDLPEDRLTASAIWREVLEEHEDEMTLYVMVTQNSSHVR